jgi:hypothetical protein
MARGQCTIQLMLVHQYFVLQYTASNITYLDEPSSISLWLEARAKNWKTHDCNTSSSLTQRHVDNRVDGRRYVL